MIHARRMRHEEEPTDGNQAALNSGTGRDVSLARASGSRPTPSPPRSRSRMRSGVNREQPGVEVSTPTPAQVPQCKVETIPNKNDPKTPLGYVVRDPAGKPVRQFVSYDGKNYNIVAFYVDGVEAYREVYPPAAGEPYQFRWLGPNGTKWGLDRDRDGKIDEWVVISPEEVSQELLPGRADQGRRSAPRR